MATHERAFAIHASPAIIWRMLLAEVEQGVVAGRAQIVHQEAPRRLDITVRLGWGLRVRYRYDIRRGPEHTEVAVDVTPFGLRHAFANIFALGRGTTPYLLATTQGLANLKIEAERAAGAPDSGPDTGNTARES